MNRRTVLAAPAAIATSSAAPAIAHGALATGGTKYDAIRARIALVCKTFSEGTIAFPDPMPVHEAEAAMALTDQQIEEMDAVIAFAERWGVNLDWLVAGQMGALLHDGRELREAERAQHAARAAGEADPAAEAFRAWHAAEKEMRDSAKHGDIPDELCDAAGHALEALADTIATTTGGLELQLRAAFEAFGDLPPGGDFDKPDDYFFDTWTRELDGRLLRSMLEGTARMVAAETGAAVSYVRPEHSYGASRRMARMQELVADLGDDDLEGFCNFLGELNKGEHDAAAEAYIAWQEQGGRAIDQTVVERLRTGTFGAA
ncbi:MAG: hypothetical protein AAFS07_11905 [Pseudomonadota bacterium]